MAVITVRVSRVTAIYTANVFVNLQKLEMHSEQSLNNVILVIVRRGHLNFANAITTALIRKYHHFTIYLNIFQLIYNLEGYLLQRLDIW